MSVDLSLSRDFYALFYQLAFAAFWLVLMIEGFRRKYPLSTWLLICTAISCSAIIGSKIGTLDATAWMSFFKTGLLPSTGQKSGFAGAVLILIGIWIIRRALGFRSPILAAFAFALPVLVFFQRIGCLMAGCCFGLPTESSWGLSYEGQGLLHDLQIASGDLSCESAQTLPVHPVPLYFMLASLGIIAILFSVRKRLRSPNHLIQLSIILLAFSRFIIEFFRDPLTNMQLGESFLGLKLIQWLLIPFMVVPAILLVQAERRPVVIYPAEGVRAYRSLAVIAVVSLFLLIFQKWFAREELIVMHVQMILAAAALLLHLYKTGWRGSHRLVPFSAVFLSFALMSLSYTDTITHPQGDTMVFMLQPKIQSPPTFSSLSPRLEEGTRRFLLVNASAANLMATAYPCATISYATGCSGESYPYCSSVKSDEPMGPGYMTYNLGYEVWNIKKGITKVAIVGQIEHYYNSGANFSGFRANLFPSIAFESKRFFGIRLGLRAGSIFLDEVKVNGNKSVLPTLRLWLGMREYLTLEGGMLDSDIGGPGAILAHLQVNIWPGFGKKDLGQVSLGFARYFTIGEGNIYYLTGQVPLSSQLRLTPSIGITRDSYQYYLEKKSRLMGTMGLRYEFRRKNE